MTDRARSQISVNDEDGRHVAAADIEVVDPSEVRASLLSPAGRYPVRQGSAGYSCAPDFVRSAMGRCQR